MSRESALSRSSETLSAGRGLLVTDMAQRSDIEFDHRLFAEPIGRCEGCQDAKRANASLAVVSKWEQQQFELDFRAIFGASSDTCDRANFLIDNGSEHILDVRAARFTPQSIEGVSLYLAGKERAHPGAGEAESDLIREVRSQHESV